MRSLNSTPNISAVYVPLIKASSLDLIKRSILSDLFGVGLRSGPWGSCTQASRLGKTKWVASGRPGSKQQSAESEAKDRRTTE